MSKLHVNDCSSLNSSEEYRQKLFNSDRKELFYMEGLYSK